MEIKQRAERLNSVPVRKKVKQLLAATLAVLMMNPVTGYGLTAHAQEAQTIRAFSELSGKIASQQLAVGAKESAITLPDTLNVTIGVSSTDTAGSTAEEPKSDETAVEESQSDESALKEPAADETPAEDSTVSENDAAEPQAEASTTGSAISADADQTVTERTDTEEVTSQERTLTGITWQINAERSGLDTFDSANPGTVIFYEPVPPEGYVLADGVSLPQIQVQIEDSGKWAFSRSTTLDGVEITVKAEKDVFPEGAVLHAVKVTSIEDKEKIQSAVSQEVKTEDTSTTVAELVSFDITITDTDGNELQPDTSKGEVRVSFAQLPMVKEDTASAQELKVFHMDDALNEAQGLDTTVNQEAGTLEAPAEHFSLYTVALLASQPATYTYDISEGAITITAGTNSNTLNVAYGAGLSTNNIPASQAITITGTTNGTRNRVYIVGVTAIIVLSDVSITTEKGWTWGSPIELSGGANVTLKLSGTNTLYSSENGAGISVPAGTSLTITSSSGDGSTDGTLNATARQDALNASAGYYYDGAGIGAEGGTGVTAEATKTVGTIMIKGGTITATGGAGGAGIGGSIMGTTGSITISGGKVTAAGGSYYKNCVAGIGGGLNGYVPEIKITGGEVQAVGCAGAGIGGGYSSQLCGNISISGGKVSAKGGGYGAASIGYGGNSTKTGGSVTITGGDINLNGGSIDPEATNGIETLKQYKFNLTINDERLTTSLQNATVSINDKTYTTDINATNSIGTASVTAFIPATATGDKSLTVTAGSYSWTTTVSISGTGGDVSVTISPKTVSDPAIELSASSFAYDGTAKEPFVTVKDGSTVIDSSEYTVSYSDNTNPGTAIVTVSDVAGGNYTVSGTKAFTITGATPVINVSAAPSGSTAYGNSVTFTATVLGVNSEKPTGTVTFKDGANIITTDAALTEGTASYSWISAAVGDHSIKAEYTPSSDGIGKNYSSATSEVLSYTITKQNQSALNIDNIGTKYYGDGSFTLSAAGGSGTGAVTFQSSDPAIVSISGATATVHKAGIVTITATKAATDTYNEAIVSVVLTVGKKTLTVKADDKLNIIKGTAMPELTYSVTGLAGSDTLTSPAISTAAADTGTVGEYDIVISGGTLANADSYTVGYESGRLTVVNEVYTVTVTNGTGGGSYSEGQTVTITADSPSGYTFTGWNSSDGITLAGSTASTTTFTMPGKAVTVTAMYKAIPNTTNGGGGGGSSGGSSASGGGTTVTGSVVNGTTGANVSNLTGTVTTDKSGSYTVSLQAAQTVTFQQTDETMSPLSDLTKVSYVSSGGSLVTVSAQGTINFANLAKGTDNQYTVTYNLGNGQTITLGTLDVTVSGSGTVSLKCALIDPYGIITDAATGQPVAGAKVTLYYADTERNKANGKTPDTVVALPGIDGFKPNNNQNPQTSDTNGAYGFMVFPDTDYYIVAAKDGYETYTSPTISVGQDIVHWDFKMSTPITGVNRLAGQSQVDTALAIAKANYAGTLSSVVLATADNYPDALAGSVLAYKLNAPILLVGSSEADQAKVLDYMKSNLDPSGNVYILGGTAVVSADMEGRIKAAGFSQITRLGGTDRYETSVKIAEQLMVKSGTPIVLAYGENYPDALSISSIAAENQYPILLVQKDGISDVVKNEIAAINPGKVYIIGGEGVISSAVESQVEQITSLDKTNIVRIAGQDRCATSLAVAQYFNSAGQSVCIATGNNFPDALAGSVYAANHNTSIILANGSLSDQVVNYLKGKKLTGAAIFGGEAVVSKGIEQQLGQLTGN